MIGRRVALLVAILVVVSGAFITFARAGQRSQAYVSVDLAARRATGAIGSARNSGDATQFIGCQLHATQTSIEMSCWAKDVGGDYINCKSTNENLIKAMQAITADAHLSFSWDATNVCLTLSAYTFSSYPPKQP